MQASKRFLVIIAMFIWFVLVSIILILSKVKKKSLDNTTSVRNIGLFHENRQIICDRYTFRPSHDEIFQEYWNQSGKLESRPKFPSLTYQSSNNHLAKQHSITLLDTLTQSNEQKNLTEKRSPSNLVSNSSLLAIDQYVRDRVGPSPIDNIYDFKSCRMSTCFNYARCNRSKGLRIHLVPTIKSRLYNRLLTAPMNVFNVSSANSLIYARILDIIKKSRFYESDADKACLFVTQSHTLDRDPLSASFQDGLNNLIGKHNNYGTNYLIFNLFSGSWPDYSEEDYSGMQIGAAIIAKASMSYLHYRPGFDISLPLFNISHPTLNTKSLNEQEDPVRIERKYLLSFKGKRYTVGNGSETRNSLFHLHNDRDIIMLTTCRHGKRWREIKDRRCDQDNLAYDSYDYQQLMRESSFCLIPRGRRLGSYRFLEALYNDCIPVVLSNGWIKPFETMIDWSNCVIQIDERLVLQVPDLLKGLSVEKIEMMRGECSKIYNRYFSSIEQIVLSTLNIIEKRLKFKPIIVQKS